MLQREAIDYLRSHYQKNERHNNDVKKHTLYLCGEVERLMQEISRANNYMDEDYMTIQRYKNKLESYEKKDSQ